MPTFERLPEDDGSLPVLLPTNSGSDAILTTPEIVHPGSGSVPGVVVQYSVVIAPGSAHHDICAVHGMQGTLRHPLAVSR